MVSTRHTVIPARAIGWDRTKGFLRGGFLPVRLVALLMILAVGVSCVTNPEEKKQKADVLWRNGVAFYRQGDYTSALKQFLEAEKINPDDPELQNALGQTYRAKERNDLAVESFRKALLIRPDYSDAKNNLGTAYMDMGKWDLAIPYFQEAAADLTYETPQFPLSNLGWAYHNKKNYGLAEQHYQKALKRAPTFINALRGLALTHMATGRDDEAIRLLEKAVEISPQFALLHYDLAVAYTHAREYEKALHAYDKVILLAPGSPLAADAQRAIKQMPPR